MMRGVSEERDELRQLVLRCAVMVMHLEAGKSNGIHM